jgi:hypothetical protein
MLSNNRHQRTFGSGLMPYYGEIPAAVSNNYFFGKDNQLCDVKRDPSGG